MTSNLFVNILLTTAVAAVAVMVVSFCVAVSIVVLRAAIKPKNKNQTSDRVDVDTVDASWDPFVDDVPEERRNG